MKIRIRYGEKVEFERVKATLKKLDWYNEQGYKIGLPKEITKKSPDKDIKNQIKKEYNKKAFDSYSKELLHKFNKIKNQFGKTLKEIFGENIPSDFEMFLTRYGVGGSYFLPNKIIKNVTNVKEGIKTLVHEIIHLIIQKEIDKYKIEHWEKERIVDLILNSEKFNFLKYGYWKTNYKGTEAYIDPLFKKSFFENQDKFFSKIKKVRK